MHKNPYEFDLFPNDYRLLKKKKKGNVTSTIFLQQLLGSKTAISR